MELAQRLEGARQGAREPLEVVRARRVRGPSMARVETPTRALGGRSGQARLAPQEQREG